MTTSPDTSADATPGSASGIKKGLAATAIAAATLGGVAAGATLFVPGQAGAQDGDPAVESEDHRSEESGRLSQALQPLVDDNTITESQRDAVVEQLKEARADHRARHRGFGAGEDIAEALGLEGSEIREALRDGASLADLAEQQGVDADDLVEIIVANAEERITAAVEADKIDADTAEQRLAQIEEHAEDVVNGDAEFPRRRGHRGSGGHHDAAA